MRSRRLLLAALATSALVLHCVGDDPAKDPVALDAGTDGPAAPIDAPSTPTDGPSSPDTSTSGGVDASPVADAGVDATPDAALPDAGPTCAIATGGTAGTLDPGFSSGLKAFPGLATAGGTATTYDTETIAVDSQGRIYIVGRAQNCVNATSSFDISFMRLSASGLVDMTFNNNKGYACFDVGNGSDSVLAAYVDASDRLVFAGHASNNEALIGRLLPSGSLDPSFNSTKILTFTPETAASGATYTAYGITPDGTNILVSGGDLHPFGPSTKGWILRISDSGAIDSSVFKPYVRSDVAGFRAGHVKLGDKIYLPTRKATTNEWMMVLVNAATGDPAPGTPATIALTGATTNSLPQGVTLATAAGQADQIFVVGALGTGPSTAAANWWDTAGIPTPSSKTLANFHWDPAYNRTPIARQCDHKTLIAAVTVDTAKPIIARFVGRDGSLDTKWGSNGVATIDFDGGAGTGLGGIAVTSLKDGRLLVTGQTNRLDGAWVFQLVP